MSQTTDEIFNDLQTDANGRASLAPIVNGSATGRLKMIWQGVAFIYVTLQQMWDALILQMNGIAAKSFSTTPGWYKQQCLNFQYGDTVTVINGIPAYATIDATKQIIAYASVPENLITGTIGIKVAKNISGVITPLATAEMTAFTSYINAIQGAGDRITIASLNADTIRIRGKIW